MDHNGDQSTNAIGDGLVTEIVDVGGVAHERLGEGEDRGDVGVDHAGRLVAGEVAELDAELVAGLAVVARGGDQGADVLLDEVERVLAGGAEVEEFESVRVGVVEEVGPVGVCLHVAEFDDFAEAQAEDLRADPVALGLREGGDFGDGDAV